MGHRLNTDIRDDVTMKLYAAVKLFEKISGRPQPKLWTIMMERAVR